jgi:hypothetical protein
MIYCSYPPVVTGPFITRIPGKKLCIGAGPSSFRASPDTFLKPGNRKRRRNLSPHQFICHL